MLIKAAEHFSMTTTQRNTFDSVFINIWFGEYYGKRQTPKVSRDGNMQKTARGVIQRQKYRGCFSPWQRQEGRPKLTPGAKMLSMAYAPPGAMSLSKYSGTSI